MMMERNKDNFFYFHMFQEDEEAMGPIARNILDAIDEKKIDIHKQIRDLSENPEHDSGVAFCRKIGFVVENFH